MAHAQEFEAQRKERLVELVRRNQDLDAAEGRDAAGRDLDGSVARQLVRHLLLRVASNELRHEVELVLGCERRWSADDVYGRIGLEVALVDALLGRLVDDTQREGSVTSTTTMMRD